MHAVRLRSFVWLVTGVGLTIVIMILFQSWRAQAVDPDESTLVPITPCRLMDTRASGTNNVGPRNTPIAAAETYVLQVTGTNGDCTIPSDATGVAMNVTTLGATAPSFLQLWPADEAQPVRGSSLNYLPGQSPTPNKVDVKLSAAGKVSVFNKNGTVNVIADVVGYYRSAGLQDLESRLAALEAAQSTDVAALEADVAALEADVAALETLLASMSLETVDGQPTVRFTGVNVQIVDGSGDTDCNYLTTEVCNGRGNLIVGYNLNGLDDREGSHNLVVGDSHSYTSFGGILGGFNNTATATSALLAGDGNTVSANSASVTGGSLNEASGTLSSVSGGSGNQASGFTAWVSGGVSNTASGTNSSVSGGTANDATGTASSVLGGDQNEASGSAATVAGGEANLASGTEASVLGGTANTASGTHSSASAGWGGTASGERSWVSGCSGCNATGFNASVTGGTGNSATEAYATVSGGQSNSATAVSSSVTGGSDNVADQAASTVSGGSGRVVSALGGDGFDWVGGGLFQSF